MNGYIKTGTGTWSKALNVYVKTATSTWSKITKAWVKTATGWQQWFGGGAPYIQYQVTISTTSSTYPASLTGTNYHWYNATSLTYMFQNSSDNINFYQIGSNPTTTNPAVGGSNTNGLTLSGVYFSAPTTYFRYSVTATGPGGTTTSNSSSVAVTYPAPTASSGSWTGGTSAGTTAIYNVGTFTNTNSYTTYIKRADAYNTLLATSTNATTTSYILTSADVGYQLYAYSVATGYGGTTNSSSVFSSYITAAGVAPSAPTGAVANYQYYDAVNNLYVYKPYWTNSTSGTAPISYYVQYYGQSDGYTSVQYIDGPYSSTPSTNFSVNTVSVHWKVVILATNAYGSAYSSPSAPE